MTQENRVAYVFPGQGSQFVGMGRSLQDIHPEAKQTFEEADDLLQRRISALCFEGPKAELDQTVNTQPAILVASIAAYRILKSRGRIPDVVAGHSLGEYSALVAAESLTFAQALDLVGKRAQFMHEAGKENPGGMTAIIGLPLEKVEEICKTSGAEIANINSPNQIVIAGKNDKVLYSEGLVKGLNGKVIRLQVSIAGHCSLMQPARENLEIILQNTDISDPKIPFVANVTGNFVEYGHEVRRFLGEQLTQSVQWLDSVRTIIDRGSVRRFVEVGPGKVLSGLINKIDGSVAVEQFS